MRKIIVDQKRCIGCGTCVILAPKTFKMGKGGKSEVINEKGNSKEDIQNAVDSCPVSAISYKNS
jgi:ferredoxin